MDLQLNRPANVRITIKAGPRPATASRVALALVLARAFVIGCTVAIMLTSAHNPSPISILLDGIAVLAAALATF